MRAARNGTKAWSHQRRLVGAFVATVLVALSGTVFSPQVASLAGTDVPPADAALGGLTTFEIDGNVVASTGVDWLGNTLATQIVYDDGPYNGTPSVVQQLPNISNTCPDAFDGSIFVASEDVRNNPPVPTVDPPAPNAKQDICQIYGAFERASNGDLVVYGAFTKRGDTGDGFIWFEFNKARGNSTYPTNAYRSVDDVLLAFDYGGSTKDLNAWQWDGSTWVPVPDPDGNGPLAAGDLPPDSFQGAFDEVGEQFGEFALNLTKAKLVKQNPTTPSECNAFGFGRAMTTTGNSLGATLKDDSGQFPLAPGLTNCATVLVKKTTVPTDTTSVFTVELSKVGSSSSLTTSPNPNNTLTSASTVTFSNVLPGSGYSVDEINVPSPWSKQGVTCSSPQPFSLVAGQVVTCVVTNVTQSLSLTKAVSTGVAGGTPAAANLWTLTASGPVTLSGAGSVPSTRVPAGTYTLSETGNVSGYQNGTTWVCTGAASASANAVTVAAGENVNCTITNTAIPPRLVLNKVVTNNDGGTLANTMWTLNASRQGGGTSVNGTSGASALVALGTYDLSESSVPGYRLTGWSCVGTGSTMPTTTSVTLGASALGQTVTCTATNDDIAPRLTLTKLVVNDDGGTAATSAFTLSAARSGGPTITGLSGTTGAASLGTYALSETGPTADYDLTLSCSGPGASTSGANLTLAQLDADVTCTFTNNDKPKPFAISVTPELDTNPIGQDHVFTVTLLTGPAGGSAVSPVANATVSLSWSGSGIGIVAGANGTGTSTTCTTDGNGQCKVTVAAPAGGATGQGSLTATYDLPYGNVGQEFPNPPDNTNGITSTSTRSDKITDSGQKIWKGWGVTISNDATNYVNDPHPFTITVVETAPGTTVTTPASGVTVAYTWTGPASSSASPATSCLTNSAGQCTVTVTSPNTGVGTVTVTQLNGTIAGKAATQTVTGVDTQKTWVNFALTVTPDEAENLLPVDADHEFTVQLTTSPAGVMPIAGQNVSVSLATLTGATGASIKSIGGVAQPAGTTSATCTTNASGACTVIVTSANPGEVRLTATYGKTISDVARSFSDIGDKTWVRYALDVTPNTARNWVGTTHTVTVTVTKDSGTGPVAVVGAKPAIQVTNASTTQNTCATSGTNGSGQCLVVIQSSTPGTSTVTASYEASAAQSTQTELLTETVEKVWVDYAVDVTPDTATNLFPTDALHEFTVTLTSSPNLTAAPVDGKTIQLTLSSAVAKIVKVNGSSVTPTLSTTCVTDDGVCTVVVETTGPGTASLQAQYGEEIDGVTQNRSDSAAKAWQAFSIAVSPSLAYNYVGTTHTVTVTVKRDTGSGFQPLAGAVPSLSITNASTVSNTCPEGTDAAGQCAITITSSTPGTSVITASYQATAADTSSDKWQTLSAAASKVWQDFDLDVTPGTATNLLPGDPNHTFTIKLTAFPNAADAASRTVTFSLDSSVASVTNVVGKTGAATSPQSCVTDANGECTVTITGTAPGTAVLSASFGSTIEQVNRTFNASAQKTYVSYRVAITPETDQNLVNTDHVFTVAVEQNQGDGLGWRALTGAKPAVQVSAGATVKQNLCADPGTGASGTCTLTITSALTGTTSVTATFQATAANSATPQSFADTATKTWQDYRMLISTPVALNAITDPHTFEFTLQKDSGNGQGFQPLGSTAPVTVTVVGTGLITAINTVPVSPAATQAVCTTDANGKCFVTVLSSTPGALDVTASYLGVSGNTSKTVSATATKTWEKGELDIDKSDADAVTRPGGTFDYTIVVSNTGDTFGVNDVTVVDPLPAGLSATAVSGTDWLCAPSSGATFTCVYGKTLLPGTSAPTLTATVKVADSHPATVVLVNTATATGREAPDPVSDTEETPLVNLAVDKKAESEFAVAGQTEPVTYTITVSNAGSADPTAAVTLEDELPPGFTLVSVTGEGIDCTEASTSFSCTIPAERLELGESVTLTVLADVPATVPQNQDYVNVVTIDSPEDPLCPGEECLPPPPSCPEGVESVGSAADNTDCATITVSGEVDTAIEKTASKSTLIAGATLTYTLAVQNLGPSAASSVQVTDTIPDAFDIEGVTTNDDDLDCDVDGNEITCDLSGTLVKGRVLTVTIDVTLVSTSVEPITNRADVSSTQDPNNCDEDTNDCDEVTTPIRKIDIAKTASATSVLPGSTFSYTLLVSNLGSTGLATVNVTDELPSELSLEGVTADDWACTTVTGFGGSLDCDLPGGLGVDDTKVITLDVLVSTAAAAGDIPNTAVAKETVPADPRDDVLPPVDDTEVVTVQRIIKVAAAPACRADTPLYDYTVIANFNPEGAPITAAWNSTVNPSTFTQVLSTDGSTTSDTNPLAGEWVEGPSEGWYQSTGTDILWPGTKLGPDGTAIDWPGWELVDGQWRFSATGQVAPGEDFAGGNLRGDDTFVVFSVNPDFTIGAGVLVYPSTSPGCFLDPPATITVVKATDETEPATFDFELTGSATESFSLTAGASQVFTVRPGTFAVVEQPLEFPWRLDDVECTTVSALIDGEPTEVDFGLDGPWVATTLDNGEQIACTYTNETFDLEVGKTHVATPGGAFLPGDEVTWLVTVENIGSGDAIGDATVSDYVPEGLVVVEEALPEGATLNGNKVSLTLPASVLTAGSSVTVSLLTRVADDTLPATYRNVVVVDHPDDPACPDVEVDENVFDALVEVVENEDCIPPCPEGSVPGTNVACDEIVVDPVPGLQILKRLSRSFEANTPLGDFFTAFGYDPGSTAVYQFRVTNTGNTPLTGVVVNDTLTYDFAGNTEEGRTGIPTTADLQECWADNDTSATDVVDRPIADAQRFEFGQTLPASAYPNGTSILPGETVYLYCLLPISADLVPLPAPAPTEAILNEASASASYRSTLGEERSLGAESNLVKISFTDLVKNLIELDGSPQGWTFSVDSELAWGSTAIFRMVVNNSEDTALTNVRLYDYISDSNFADEATQNKLFDRMACMDHDDPSQAPLPGSFSRLQAEFFSEAQQGTTGTANSQIRTFAKAGGGTESFYARRRFLDPNPVTRGDGLPVTNGTTVVENLDPDDGYGIVCVLKLPSLDERPQFPLLPGESTIKLTNTFRMLADREVLDARVGDARLFAGAPMFAQVQEDVETGTVDLQASASISTEAPPPPPPPPPGCVVNCDFPRTPVVDLGIVKSAVVSATNGATVTTVLPGGLYTYKLTVTNVGQDPAINASVTDTLPAVLAIKKVTPSTTGVTCTTAGQKVTCAKDGLNPGQSFDVFVDVQLAATGLTNGQEVVNIGDVTGQDPDPNLTNNRDDARIRVNVPVPVPIELPRTGSDPHRGVQLGIVLTMLGMLFVLATRKRVVPIRVKR